MPNPQQSMSVEAAGLMTRLLARSMDENYGIVRSLYEAEKARADELQQRLDWALPLAQRYLTIRRLLRDDTEYE